MLDLNCSVIDNHMVIKPLDGSDLGVYGNLDDLGPEDIFEACYEYLTAKLARRK